MGPHLDSTQIEELLRASSNKKEDSANDEIDASARIHLKDCYICQMRVRAEGKAMERLAQLKPSETATRSPQCPPDSVWLEFAAGFIRILKICSRMQRNATTVHHCLRDAVADLTGECTPTRASTDCRPGQRHPQLAKRSCAEPDARGRGKPIRCRP